MPNSPVPSCLLTHIESAGMMCLLLEILLGDVDTRIVSSDVVELINYE